MKHVLFLATFFLLSAHAVCSKIVIGLVIDQLPYTVFMDLLPHMKGGIRTLVDHGIFYHNAVWPYAQPGTAQGHVGLVTGTIPAIHGVIANDWMTPEGVTVAFGDDTSTSAAVFSPQGTYSFGKSAALCMVDTLPDQLVMQKGCYNNAQAYTFTLKSRSAIGMAGRLGKAVWFDHETGYFTSSKAYFDELPAWLHTFNQKIRDTLDTYTWSRFFSHDSCAYRCTRTTSRFKRKDCPFDRTISRVGTYDSNFYKILAHTPAAHELTLACAAACIESTYDPRKDSPLLFLIGLSAVDKTGHLYGPESCEYADILYHLDAQIDDFMKRIKKIMPTEDIVYFLTSDHGCMPIPESLHEKKFDAARRLVTTEIKDTLNKLIEHTFALRQCVVQIDPPNVYLDHHLIKTLDKKRYRLVEKALIKQLKNIPGIKNAWTYQELTNCSCGPDDERFVFKNQSYQKRSGQIIFQVLPYTYISKYSTGTGHKSPYRYDTHVPLIFFQSSESRKQSVYSPVFIPQVAATLAHIFGISQPSACSFTLLDEFKNR